MTGTDRQASKAIWIPAPGKALDDKPDMDVTCLFSITKLSLPSKKWSKTS